MLSVASHSDRLIRVNLEADSDLKYELLYDALYLNQSMRGNRIVIDRIGVSATIFDDISTLESSIYNNALKNGVAHIKGTSHIDDIGPSFVFAHSSRSVLGVNQGEAIFANLKLLEYNDKIVIYYRGVKHEYRVYDKLIVPANDNSIFKASLPEKSLVLITCDPPGTSVVNRLIVLSKKVGQ